MAPGGAGTLALDWQNDDGGSQKIAAAAAPIDRQFVLTLDDDNTVFNVGIEAIANPDFGGLSDTHLGGINGQGTTGAWIYGNTFDLALEATGYGFLGLELPPDPGETVDDRDEPIGIGVDGSSLIALDLGGSTDATVEGNDIHVSIEGTGGSARTGSHAIYGGDGETGDAGEDPSILRIVAAVEAKAFEDGGVGQNGGSALAASGGAGVKDSTAIGISLGFDANGNRSQGATVIANTIEVAIAGQGGAGGDAQGGDGGIGGEGFVDIANAVMGVGGTGGAGGGALGGDGGAGLETVSAVGIAANEAIDAMIGGNMVTAMLDGTGGRGGMAAAGDGGAGGEGFDRGGGGDGGNATGGTGGDGVTGGRVFALELAGSSGPMVQENGLVASATGKGGAGGSATSGDGGVGGDPEDTDGGKSGGNAGDVSTKADTGAGGDGLEDVLVYGLDLVKLEAPPEGIVDNTIMAAMTGTGGVGGDSIGGAGGSGGFDGVGFAASVRGASGGMGIRQSELRGVNATGITFDAVDPSSGESPFRGNTIALSVVANGGAGGSGTGGDGALADLLADPDAEVPLGEYLGVLPGFGAAGIGGNGGHAVFETDVVAIDLFGTTDAWLDDNQVEIAVEALGGLGGSAYGGDGGDDASNFAAMPAPAGPARTVM